MEKIKNVIFNNLHLKILSLLVAFLLWLNIVSLQKTRFEFYSEVKILNRPPDMKIEKVYPEKVLIVIEGIRSKLDKVKHIQNKSLCRRQASKEGQEYSQSFRFPQTNSKF
ncbi:MAG: YbbR-like domain-containing protein [Persephonella sp.]|nr:YbbR-like domain-containing protein [Persephonella sp.]